MASEEKVTKKKVVSFGYVEHSFKYIKSYVRLMRSNLMPTIRMGD